MNENQIPAVIHQVRERLETLGKERAVALKLEDRQYQLEDEWLYLLVTPDQAGIHASDYAKLLSDIEKELRAQGINNVLLVPTIEE